MEKRICGREQEFGVRILSASVSDSKRSWWYWPYWFLFGETNLAYAEYELCSDIINKIGHSGIPYLREPYYGPRIWLANGSLVYVDRGLLETASAEYLAGSLDGILQEKSSELIIGMAAELVREKRGWQSLSFYKNNVGPSGSDGSVFSEVSYASHHNYSYAAKQLPGVYDLLLDFIPVSLPLTGSGHVYSDYGYLLSQRARHVTQRISSSTFESRGIINTRHEPLVRDSLGLNRLHLISRDATRCEFQTWLVDLITHLVIRLAEEGWELPPGKRLIDPVAEMRNVNLSFVVDLDHKVRCVVPGDNGLLEYNWLFLNAARQLSPLSPTEKKGLEEWERVLELLKARAFEKLVGELDWATKLYLIKNKMAKYNFGLNDLRAWKIDMGYHDISSDPKRSWFALLEQEGYIKHLVTQDQIKKAMATPPQNTRAKARGELVRRSFENPELLRIVNKVSWESVCLYQQPVTQVFYDFGEKGDPFSEKSRDLEDFYRAFGIQE